MANWRKSYYKERTFTCRGCGKVVKAHVRRSTRYCSHACYATSSKPERKRGSTSPCVHCGKPVYALTGRRKTSKSIFCSRTCANAYQGRNKTVHTCTICSKTFRRSPSAQKNGTVKYCSIACRNLDPEKRKQLINMNRAQQDGKRTSIEVIGYDILDGLNIKYEPQFMIGRKFCVDAWVESRGVVIQFDGDYWHGHPIRFPNPSERQQRRMKLDKSQDAYMRACGYSVIRIWGTDLRKNQKEVKLRLSKMICPE